MLVKIDHFPNFRGSNKSLKPNWKPPFRSKQSLKMKNCRHQQSSNLQLQVHGPQKQHNLALRLVRVPNDHFTKLFSEKGKGLFQISNLRLFVDDVTFQVASHFTTWICLFDAWNKFQKYSSKWRVKNGDGCHGIPILKKNITPKNTNPRMSIIPWSIELWKDS